MGCFSSHSDADVSEPIGSGYMGTGQSTARHLGEGTFYQVRSLSANVSIMFIRVSSPLSPHRETIIEILACDLRAHLAS